MEMGEKMDVPPQAAKAAASGTACPDWISEDCVNHQFREPQYLLAFTGFLHSVEDKKQENQTKIIPTCFKRR